MRGIATWRGCRIVCLFVCLRRTYSDVEGLEGQCLRCPGDKNYTIVKVRLCARFS